MLRRTLITLLLCLNSFFAFAQVNDSKANEGSFYSKFGIGMPVDYGSSSADGMGLWGVSHAEPLVPGLANPAQWGSTVYGMASGGIGIDNYHGQDNFSTANNSLVSLNHFQLQLPILKNKLGISVSFSPFSRRAFKSVQTGDTLISNANTTDQLNYQTNNIGTGGVGQYEIGVGWKITPHISLGYAASLFHASIDNEFITSFDTTRFGNGNYIPVNNTLQTSATGFGNRLGAYFTIPSLFRENDQLNIGTVVRFPVKMNGDKVQESTFVSGDPNDKNAGVERKLNSGDIHIPLGLTAGLTYEPSQRVAISTEGRYEKWSEYENTIDPEKNTNISFADRMKVGAGLKFYPFVSGSNKFFSQFKYRLGASYDSGHLKIAGQNVKTLMFSAGFGILTPTRVNGFNSSVDISFHYGIRGTKDQNLVKESVWGVKLSVNLAELFFFRPKLR